jgi:hypothetical protein
MEDVQDGKKIRRERLRKVWKASGYVLSIITLALLLFSAFRIANLTLEALSVEAQNLALRQSMKLVLQKDGGLKDPTTNQLISFLNEDATEEQNYSSKFNCVNFSAMMVSHAVEDGWNCGLVQIWFKGILQIYPFVEMGHVMVAFNVTDAGPVFVEPQTDDLMPSLEPGDSYMNHTIQSVEINWLMQ